MRKTMYWEQILTVFAVIGTNLGTVISLYCQMDKKQEDHIKETFVILMGIQQEMKKFHTQLALQDKEFKMRLCAIEERSKGK